jgi:hypothetical protein
VRYGELVSRSFEIFWHRRYLWLLGALGGGQAAGSGLGFTGNAGNVFTGEGPPGPMTQALSNALPLLIVLGALLAVFAIAYFLISCAATGALVRAGAEHDAERPFSLGEAWRAGGQSFLRILGLRLLVAVVELVAVLVLGAVIAAGVAAALSDQVAAAAVAFVLGAVFLVLLVPVVVVLSIVMTLAVRAIVLERLGTLPAVARGARLLFGRLGRTLLVWLLSLGLGLGVSLALGLVAVALATPAVAVGAIAYSAGGWPALVPVGAVVLTLVIVALVLVGGAAGSYLTVYWTLAFRRLELELTPSGPPVELTLTDEETGQV